MRLVMFWKLKSFKSDKQIEYQVPFAPKMEKDTTNVKIGRIPIHWHRKYLANLNIHFMGNKSILRSFVRMKATERRRELKERKRSEARRRETVGRQKPSRATSTDLWVIGRGKREEREEGREGRGKRGKGEERRGRREERETVEGNVHGPHSDD